AASARFELRPLLAYRDHRQRCRENPGLQRHPTQPYNAETGLLEVAPYAGMPPLRLLARHAEFLADGFWYRHFKYAANRPETGAVEEDLYSYGVLALTLDSLHPTAYLVATTEDYDSITLERLIQMRRREINRRTQILDAVPSNDEFLRNLALAADAFLISPATRRGLTITLGYPWAVPAYAPAPACLPGLTLTTRRYDKAKAVLSACLEREGWKGTAPSRAADPEEPLWLLYALYQYAQATRDYDFVVRKAYPVMAEWVHVLRRGDYAGLVLDESHLLAHPAQGVKAVDTNAL